MANTRTAAKRVRQARRRQDRNQEVKSHTKSLIRRALDSVAKKDQENLKQNYQAAARALDKAVSKGVLPRRRASRKISRLAAKIKKISPQVLQS